MIRKREIRFSEKILNRKPDADPTVNHPALADKRALLQLGLRVHHDRAVPGDRLLDRLTRHEDEADAIVAGLHADLIAGIEQHQRTIAGPLAYKDLVLTVGLFGQ